MRKLRVGTRGSLLALTQTRWFTQQLKELTPDLEVVEVLIQTEGDLSTAPLSESKNPGVFVSALREALLAGEVDFVVHSMKDLPAKPHPDIVTACVPEREDVRDALVSKNQLRLKELPIGALVGTSSPRRAASIRRLRPDLRVKSIRGNVDSRIQKVRTGEFDATVLAAAGLRRIGKESEACEFFDASDLVPAPGQGALSVECRTTDVEIARLLGSLNHQLTAVTTAAERSVLVGLDAGCATAIGAHAVLEGDELKLIAELSVEQTGESLLLSSSAQINLEDLGRAQQLGLDLAMELLRSEIATRAAFK